MSNHSLPLVSIVTPALNQGEYLEATMRSVLEQDYPRIEYIVIDGGSTDATPGLLERYASRLAYWTSEPDRGQAQAINKGLRRSSGDLLGWLNADDLLLPGAITRSVQIFQEHPEIDVIYGRLERVNASGVVIPTPELPKDRVVFGSKLVIGECVVNQPGALWRRAVMERSGLLNEDLEYALDYEYWIRLVLDGARFHRLTAPVARFRLHSGSKTVSRTAWMAEEQERVLLDVLKREDLPWRLGLSESEIREQARRAFARIRLHAAYGYIRIGDRGRAVRRAAAALAGDPGVIFERRWYDLLFSRLKRPQAGPN